MDQIRTNGQIRNKVNIMDRTGPTWTKWEQSGQNKNQWTD